MSTECVGTAPGHEHSALPFTTHGKKKQKYQVSVVTQFLPSSANIFFKNWSLQLFFFYLLFFWDIISPCNSVWSFIQQRSAAYLCPSRSWDEKRVPPWAPKKLLSFWELQPCKHEVLHFIFQNPHKSSRISPGFKSCPVYPDLWVPNFRGRPYLKTPSSPFSRHVHT